jgi:hypothetical protein
LKRDTISTAWFYWSVPKSTVRWRPHRGWSRQTVHRWQLWGIAQWEKDGENEVAVLPSVDEEHRNTLQNRWHPQLHHYFGSEEMWWEREALSIGDVLLKGSSENWLNSEHG